MNKYQKALDRFEEAFRNITLDDDLTNERRDLLQELVNKTIPMRPKKEWMTGSGTTAICELVCSECTGMVEEYFEYCPYCSQRLDWSEND